MCCVAQEAEHAHSTIPPDRCPQRAAAAQLINHRCLCVNLFDFDLYGSIADGVAVAYVDKDAIK